MIIGGIDFKKLNSLSELDEGSSLTLRNSKLDNKSGPVITDNDVIEIFKECYANRFGIEVHTDSDHLNYSTNQIEKDISIRISDLKDLSRQGKDFAKFELKLKVPGHTVPHVLTGQAAASGSQLLHNSSAKEISAKRRFITVLLPLEITSFFS